jgi:hypothetical protein
MKAWLHNFLLLFWPWSKIEKLEKALAYENRQLIAALDRYNSAYRDGFTHHLQTWMANANVYYGPEPFTDSQRSAMIDIYNRGYTSKEALDMLRLAEGRNRTWTR